MRSPEKSLPLLTSDIPTCASEHGYVHSILHQRQISLPGLVDTSASPRPTSSSSQGRFPMVQGSVRTRQGEAEGGGGFSTLLLVFIPLMVVVLTLLLGLVLFLAAVLYMRRRKGIR